MRRENIFYQAKLYCDEKFLHKDGIAEIIGFAFRKAESVVDNANVASEKLSVELGMLIKKKKITGNMVGVAAKAQAIIKRYQKVSKKTVEMIHEVVELSKEIGGLSRELVRHLQMLKESGITLENIRSFSGF